MSGPGSDLVAFALSLPEATVDHPWGETVCKVGKKVFCFCSADPDDPDARISVKLPDSRDEALGLPGATPTGYGLGRSGWVTVPVAAAPAGVLEDLVEESYRTVAPRRLVRLLDARP